MSDTASTEGSVSLEGPGSIEGPGVPSTDEPGASRGSWAMGDPATENAEPKSGFIGMALLVGLLGYLWVAAGLGTFLFVIGLIVMIFLHELGHFMTARWTGMKATQFFLGMGPRIWSFRRGETEYGVRAIPAGAFVRIVGMNNLDPIPPGDEARAYKNQSYWKRMVVITAGSGMHFIQALVLFTLTLSVIGVPAVREENWRIAEISQLETGETPAIAAGLELGDTIVAIDGVPTPNWSDVAPLVAPRPGEEVTLEIAKANGTMVTAVVELVEYTDPDGTTRGFIGIAPERSRERLGPLAGVQQFGEIFTGTLGFIPEFLSPSTFARLGEAVFNGGTGIDAATNEIENRPISVVGVVRIAGQDGNDWIDKLFILGLINISIGIINLIPLLPLDGGHAAIATYERLRSFGGRRHEVDVARLLPLTYGVVAVLAFLMISTVWLDIVDPLG